MSQAFAQKHDQAVTDLGCGYRISSAGADVLRNRVVRGATLDISNRVFRVNLVVMPGLVPNVIMGMNWMKEWDVVLDVGKRMLSLREPQGSGSFQVPLPRRFDFASISCATQVVPLPQIPVDCEFPDVFPEELPGLLLDREVEFAIELIPGTTPIYVAILDAAQRDRRAKDPIKRFIGQGFHPAKFVRMGLPDVVCEKEGSIVAHVRGLSSTQCGNN